MKDRNLEAWRCQLCVEHQPTETKEREWMLHTDTDSSLKSRSTGHILSVLEGGTR